MLGRSLLNHVPPIFGFTSFNEVENNYAGAGKSFKNSIKDLNNTLRNIADRYLHNPIRNKESLPNENQVNFSQNLDVLLEEIYRILK
jgi:hypothetical protein